MGEHYRKEDRATDHEIQIGDAKFEFLTRDLEGATRKGYLQFFVQVDELGCLLEFEIVIEYFGGSRKIEIAREKEIFEKAFLCLSFVVDNVLAETALSERDDYSLSGDVLGFIGERPGARLHEVHISRLKRHDVK